MGGRVRATLGIKAEYLGGAGSRANPREVGVNPCCNSASTKKKNKSPPWPKKSRPEQADPLSGRQAGQAGCSGQDQNTMRRLLDRRRSALLKTRLGDANLSESAKVEVSAGVYSGTTVNIGKQSALSPKTLVLACSV